MAKTLVAVGVVLFSAWISTNPLVACGDKNIGGARGGRYQLAPRGKQEAILVFSSPSSEVARALARVAPTEVLRDAGYQPTLVLSREDFETKVKQRHWDLVVVSVEDAAESVKTARILPVALNVSKSERKAIKKTYRVVLDEVPNRDRFVRIVEDALGS